jgi:hypothetical protein
MAMSRTTIKTRAQAILSRARIFSVISGFYAILPRDSSGTGKKGVVPIQAATPRA